MIKFYHYPHCPFCQRVRLLLGYLQLPYESIVLDYSDKDTPMQLCGSRTLPIIDIDGQLMNESVDIMRALLPLNKDQNLVIDEADINWASGAVWSGVPGFGTMILPFCTKYYRTTEWDERPAGERYFIDNKSQKIGLSFKALREQAPVTYTEQAEPAVQKVLEGLKGNFIQSQIGLADMILAADLSGLRMVEGIDLPSKLIDYLERVEATCQVELIEV